MFTSLYFLSMLSLKISLISFSLILFLVNNLCKFCLFEVSSTTYHLVDLNCWSFCCCWSWILISLCIEFFKLFLRRSIKLMISILQSKFEFVLSFWSFSMSFVKSIYYLHIFQHHCRFEIKELSEYDSLHWLILYDGVLLI